jgi:hypothetical protein
VRVWQRSWPIGTARKGTSGGRGLVLLSADRVGTAEIMRRTGLSKQSVWRRQERYVEAGVDGLLRIGPGHRGYPR